MESLQAFFVLSTFLLGLYYWCTWTFNFWKSRGVKGPTPLPLVGNMKDVIMGKSSLATLTQKYYNQHRDQPAIGVFLLREPAIMLTDLDLVKNLLHRDFATFADRGLRIFEKVEPLTQHLVNLEPARWAPIRKSMAPGFTNGKVKKRFDRLLECGEQLEKYLDKLTETNEVVECHELTAKFATDVIGTYAFSIQMNSLEDEESDFRKMGRALFVPNWRNVTRLRLRESSPFLYSIFGRLLCDSHITGYFGNLLTETMYQRKKHGIVKNDLIDLAADLHDHPDKFGDLEVTDSLLASQLFVFFLGGYQTTSTAMGHTLYELAQNQSIQDKLRNEIKGELAKTNGQLSYEMVTSMKYLDMVWNETLRKYPPVALLTRKAGAEHTFDGTKVTIPEGTRVIVPVYAIHQDPKVWPKPDEFDPERFTEEAISARHPMSWLPFGGGRRICIGSRLAINLCKIGLIKILQNHKVEVCDKTPMPYVLNPRTIFTSPMNGIHVKVSKAY